MKFGISKMFGVDTEVVPDKVVIHELPDRPYQFPIKRDSKRKMRRQRGRLKGEARLARARNQQSFSNFAKLL